MNASDNWTAPYCGVTHLRTASLAETGCQFTVNDYGDFAVAAIYRKTGGPIEHPFPTAAEAKAWLEDQARGRGIEFPVGRNRQ